MICSNVKHNHADCSKATLAIKWWCKECKEKFLKKEYQS